MGWVWSTVIFVELFKSIIPILLQQKITFSSVGLGLHASVSKSHHPPLGVLLLQNSSWYVSYCYVYSQGGTRTLFSLPNDLSFLFLLFNCFSLVSVFLHFQLVQTFCSLNSGSTWKLKPFLAKTEKQRFFYLGRFHMRSRLFQETITWPKYRIFYHPSTPIPINNTPHSPSCREGFKVYS